MMRKLLQQVGLLWLCIAILILPWGCATHPPPPFEFPQNLRSQLGTIGVDSTLSINELIWQTPSEGWAEGLGEGASKGVKVTAGYGLLHGGGLIVFGTTAIFGLVIIALGLALAPPAALIGGVYGAIAAESPEAVEKAAIQLQQTWERQNPHVDVQAALIKIAQEKTNQTLVPLKCLKTQEPSVPDDCVALERDGIDTVLNLNMTSLALAGESGVNPPIHLSLVLHVKVIRTADNVVLDDQFFDYSGGGHTFLEWAANDAQLLKEEFSQAYQGLAEQIIAYLFLTPPSLSLPHEVDVDDPI